jgi:hypothetical protein
MTTHNSTLSISSLSDTQALRTLSLVLDRQDRLPDPTRLKELDTQARQAATSLAHDRDLNITPDANRASAGDLARDTLTYLATTHHDLTTTIQRAITLTSDNSDTNQAGKERIEPATLAIGALVVLALQTEVSLERGTTGKWEFAFHKKGMSDNALTRLLAKLAATFTQTPH